MKKQIAWGASKLLKLFLRDNPDAATRFSYCIDSFAKVSSVAGIPILRPEALSAEGREDFEITIFAVSSVALQDITASLGRAGLQYRRDFYYYSDLFKSAFQDRVQKKLGFRPESRLYEVALSYTLSSAIPVHTTIPGTWLLLELLKQLDATDGAIAEVGAYRGGNALAALSFLNQQRPKTYYLFDSFEGFPDLSEFDPRSFSRGDYAVGVSYQEICNCFEVFEAARVIKGFVPGTFSTLPPHERFSLVFYDCDLYQPALDTYAYFWDRLVPGGYLVIHDYEAEEGGFMGVKKATDEFFASRGHVDTFYENTMAIIRK